MKKIISFILLFSLFFANINAAFAAEGPPEETFSFDVASLPELEPVTAEVNNSLEINGGDSARIKPLLPTESGLLDNEADPQKETADKVKVIARQEITITDERLAQQEPGNNPEASLAASSLPDIAVYDLKPATGQVSPFVALSDTRLEFTIANLGTASTGNFTVGIVVDSVLMGSFTETSLAPYTGIIYTITLQQVPEGYHTVRIVGDYNNTVSESNEANNSANGFYQWVGKPNFKADYLNANRTPPYEAGTSVQLSFRVSNNGNGKAAGNSFVELRVNGETIATWTITDWLPQTYLEDTISLTFNRAGSYLVEIRADPANLVAESNETDNTISAYYSVVAAQQITISGFVIPSFRFSHQTGTTPVATPLNGFKVRLLDDDIILNDEIATTYTNASGYFEVTVNNQLHEDGIDLFLQLDFDDSIVSVRPGNGNGSYRLESSVLQNIHVGTINFGTLPLTNLPLDIEGAFSIWYWIRRGHDYYALNSNAGASIPKVSVNWADGVGTGAYHSGTTIMIGGDAGDQAAFDGDIILHEYGHHIMVNTVGFVPGSGGTHTYTTPSSLATAYSEAWAHFFSTSVRNTATIKDTNPNGWFGANLETPAFIDSSGANTPTPLVNDYEVNAQYELNVAGVLWDLFDNAIDGVDLVTHGFATVDNVMRTSSNRHAYDFYDRWFAGSGSPYSKETIWNIFESRKNSYDVQVPFVSISVTGTTVQASATDNITVKKFEWYVDGNFHSQGNGSSGTFNGLQLSPGFHLIEFRAYDPEGLLAYSTPNGRPTRPRADRYGSALAAINVPGSDMRLPEAYSKNAILSNNPRQLNEHRNRLIDTVTAKESIILNEIDLLDVGDISHYNVLVDKNEDLRIYSHILGIIKSIQIIAPDDSLYQSYDYISPDRPVVIHNAEPGEWTIQLDYLTQEDLEKYNVAADTTLPGTPVAIIATTAPAPVHLQVPEITNNPNIIHDLFSDTISDSSIDLVLNNNPNDGKFLLAEGLNKLLAARVKGNYTSDTIEYVITLDTSAPDIQLSTKEQIKTTDDIVLIQGTVEDDVEHVTINGAPVQLSEFVRGFAQYYPLNSGLNPFTVTAVDQAGNVTEKKIIVTKP